MWYFETTQANEMGSHLLYKASFADVGNWSYFIVSSIFAPRLGDELLVNAVQVLSCPTTTYTTHCQLQQSFMFHLFVVLHPLLLPALLLSLLLSQVQGMPRVRSTVPIKLVCSLVVAAVITT